MECNCYIQLKISHAGCFGVMQLEIYINGFIANNPMQIGNPIISLCENLITSGICIKMNPYHWVLIIILDSIPFNLTHRYQTSKS